MIDEKLLVEKLKEKKIDNLDVIISTINELPLYLTGEEQLKSIMKSLNSGVN